MTVSERSKSVFNIFMSLFHRLKTYYDQKSSETVPNPLDGLKPLQNPVHVSKLKETLQKLLILSVENKPFVTYDL
jgi:hypothetical protein